MQAAGSAPAPASPGAEFDEFIARSLARPPLSHQFEGAGITLHYLEWPGPRDAPPLLLLHGFMAHAHWWDFVAPWLAEHHRVIALDFGGMGDSARRDVYRLESFLDEIAAVIRHAGIEGCAAVGHSFGGRALLRACVRHPGLVSRAIIVDSRLVTPDDPMRPFDPAGRPRRRYASEAEILARFTLMPVEPAPAAALAHMGRASIRRHEDGWSWKFDERVTTVFAGDEHRLADDVAALADLDVPVDLIYGELSAVVDARRAAKLTGSVPHGRPPVCLPCGYHHLPVSQPLPLLAALRTLLLPPHR